MSTRGVSALVVTNTILASGLTGTADALASPEVRGFEMPVAAVAPDLRGDRAPEEARPRPLGR